MRDPRYVLDTDRREIVLKSIEQVCLHHNWTLIAVHVRTTHVHVLIDADSAPETIMHAFKAYASRNLNRHEAETKRWTRHGSTRYLWRRDEVTEVADYVIRRQGEAMAVFSGDRSVTVAAR
jgi:REP element-mobilizing transposase RayT